MQQKADRRLSESLELYARTLRRAGRRRDGEAAVLRHGLLLDYARQSDRHHSQGHSGRFCAAARPRPLRCLILASAKRSPATGYSPGRPGNEVDMIPRYSRQEMTAIWSPETRFRIWFEIEAHAADAIAELERETKHDVIAFLTHLAEIIGPEARFVHQGMTSSDVLDTCLNVQLVRAA